MERLMLLYSQTLYGLIWPLNHSSIQQNSLKDSPSDQWALVWLCAYLTDPLQQSEFLSTSALRGWVPKTGLLERHLYSSPSSVLSQLAPQWWGQMPFLKREKRGQKPI